MDKALLRRVEKQAWFHRHPRGFPLVLLLLTAIVTLCATAAIEISARTAQVLRLDRNAAEIAGGLQRRAADNIAALGAAAAVFSARGEVSPQAFADFAAAMDYGRGGNALGAVGIGWAPRIARAAIPAFEASMRAAGTAGYTVHPVAPGASFAMPVAFIAPATRTSYLAMGYDMYTEAPRRVAIDAAMRLGRPTISGPVRLQRDAASSPTRAGPGFLMFMPVFASQGDRHVVRGLVYSPFHAAQFLESAIELAGRRQTDVALYDTAKLPANLLAAHWQTGMRGATVDRTISIAGHPWVLSVTDTRASPLSRAALLTLVLGLAAAIALAGLAALFTRRAQLDRQVLEWLTSQEAIRNSLTRELNHRVKNTLANVLSIVSLTRHRYREVEPYAQSIVERVRALSTTYDLLSQSEWRSAPIGEIARNELAPYIGGKDGHVQLSGPEIRLAPNDALSIGLALHELATNAAKYGALSVDSGRVTVVWRLITPELAELDWWESGGPPVAAPTKRGFGMDLIEKIVAAELHTDVRLTFAATGVECRLRAPVRFPGEFDPG